jgi:hypothetical protein
MTMGLSKQSKRSRATPAKRPSAPAQTNFPCTFDLGYVRQDVYACTKCSTPQQPSGFCSSCKFACHGDHLEAVFDLYSKRGFRCDCGNSRSLNGCQLEPNKPPVNEDNACVYSHNFSGLYCRCNRGYDPKLGDMSQCAMCEDWFHSRCLSVLGLSKRAAPKVLKTSSYELICGECVARLPVLRLYYHTLGKFVPKSIVTKAVVWPSGKPRSEACVRPEEELTEYPEGTDILWNAGFRDSLCACDECKEAYTAAGVGWIVDPTDAAGDVTLEGAKGARGDGVLDGTEDRDILDDVRRDAGSSRGGKRSRAGDGGERQVEIQQRIRDFLQSSVATNGRSMTHAALRSYLADVKAEVLANLDAGGSGQ